MQKVTTWIKENKILTALLVVIFYYLFIGNSSFHRVWYPYMMDGGYRMGGGMMENSYNESYATDMMGGSLKSFAPTTTSLPYDPVAPQIEISERRTITDSSLSLLVKDVQETTDNISKEAERLGGYFVNKSVDTPYEGGTGYISVRVPLDKREEMISYLRNVGIRVLNESVYSNDITDQYVDTEAKLETLNRTLAKYESIFDQATEVDDILRVQQQILNTQNQIDRVKGQLDSYDALSKTTLINVSLSTDELALPYTPDQPWRPGVVYKLAVRSLVSTFQSLANAVIWLAVYAIVWVPVVILAIFLKKKYLKKNK